MRFLFFLTHITHILFKLPFMGAQYIRCMYHLSKLNTPIIAVFGGKRAQENGIFYEHAHTFGRLCTEHGYSVLTGGGPGSMVAANCGAASLHTPKDRSAWTLGIGVDSVDSSFINPCAKVIPVRYFFMRKWLLAHYSDAHVFFPGGIGTADEFFDLLNLAKHEIVQQKRIILVDKTYWEPLLVWYRESGIKSGMITFSVEDAFFVCDTAQEALEIIQNIVPSKKKRQ